MDPFLKMMDNVNSGSSAGSKPIVLAKEFLKAVEAKNPKRRYVKGAFAKPMIFVRKWLGDGAFEWMLRMAFR